MSLNAMKVDKPHPTTISLEITQRPLPAHVATRRVRVLKLAKPLLETEANLERHLIVPDLAIRNMAARLHHLEPV